MIKRILLFTLIPLSLMACQETTDDRTRVLIETAFGDMEVMLYNETPKHRDNFVKLVEEGFYDDLLFHRVIEGFMIQGGDPESRDAAPSAVLGMGGPGYRVDAELGFPHFRGALAAARDNNPQKNSSGSQFYIVQGKPVSANYLDKVEAARGFTYTEAQRQLYLEEGGAPQLDGDYTVFGELVRGFEVLDSIAAQPTGTYARPVQDIRMNLRVLRQGNPS